MRLTAPGVNYVIACTRKRVEGFVRKILMFLVMTALAMPAFAGDADERLRESGKVLQDIVGMEDGIPKDLLNKAECVVVLPSVKKFAIGFGGSYGRGVMTCRSGAHYTGPWSEPVMMALQGGSWGLQLGGTATDFVLLLMSPRSADSLLNNEVKLGADVSAAAGPKGRTLEAATDAALRAEVLSYSRARGLFAGVSLNGATLHVDEDANAAVYGGKIKAKEILTRPGPGKAADSKLLVAELNRISPKNESDKESLKTAPSRK
jgi:lipid-binding SYLF domain-containing protein